MCASTPTGDLKPYSSEYEGYMGNYGNTLDRWYHRAAVIVWPGDRAFANRAETSPAWALDELAAMASAGDVSGAQAAAATLASFWDGAVRARTADERGGVAGLFGKALRAADDVADAETAAMLLHPFRVENLTAAHVGSFGKIAGQYGQQWTASTAADLVRRRSASMGLRRRTGPAAMGGGSVARPVRGTARHGQRWRGGRAAAA